MKKLISILLVISILTLSILADLREDEITVFSADDYLIEDSPSIDVFEVSESIPSAILIEASSGQVLFEHDPDEKLPIASVTKVMTMLLAMEALDNGTLKLDDIVTVSANAASMGGSQAFMEEGERMSAHEMLKAIAVSSCNDAAVAMAEHIAGSESEFVSRMNERAKELGMTSTEFVNCTGLDDRDMHYSSARDVAIMSRALLSHERIFDYTTIWMDSIRDGKFGLSNTNKLIRFYDGANGLKTGSTSKARYCLSAAAKRDGMQLIAVVLGAPSSAVRFDSAKSMLDYGFANFSSYNAEPDALPDIMVTGGKKNKVKCRAEGQSLLVSKGDGAKIEEITELADALAAPVKKGDVIGKVKYVIGERVVAEIDVTAAENVGKATFFDRFSDILSRVLI